MRTRLVRVRDISKDDEEAWRRLSARALEPNPFAEPDFLLLSARHFGGYSNATLVIAQDGTEFVGVLPTVAFTSSRLPPRMIVTTRGSPTAVSALDFPLVDRSEPDQVVDALVGALGRAAKRDKWPGILLLNEMTNDGLVVESLRRVCDRRGCPMFVKDAWERGAVSRSGQWENPLHRHRRREVGRLHRLLARESGNEVHVVDRSMDAVAVEEFLTMEASGWKGRDGGQAFGRDPDKVAWFREWSVRWAARGRLIVLALNVGDVSIALQYFVRAGDGLFFFKMAYDPDYARYAPGAMLLASAFDYLREQTDAQWIDSCADGNNRFVLDMFPERRMLSRLVIGTGGSLDRRLVAALPLMTKVVSGYRRTRAPRSAVSSSPSRPAGA
jgi:CelD/BcsL family acetyltransferase involved in cellulose biosynthesis